MKRSQRSPRSFYKVVRIRYAATVAAMMLAIGGTAATTIAVSADSPAVRDQSVVAQGVATIPGGDLAWVVESKTADENESTAEVTGFLVGDEGSLLVADEDGDRTVLDGRDADVGAAEALFVDGDEATLSALDESAQYFNVELVSGDDATGEGVIGDAFSIGAGDRELSMIQGDLNDGAETAFNTSEYPVLLIATAGELRVEQADGVNGVLSAREAVLLAPGERATVSGENGPAAYVAVFVGDEVGGREPAPQPTQQPNTQPNPPAPTAEPTTAPSPDGDQDGLNDEDEAIRGTDPANPDSDNDGLEDGYEVFTSGTLPLVFDSDVDGLPDGEEIFTFGTNPSNVDTDGDGLNDYLEAIDYQIDPTSSDTDGDGLDDYAELMTYFTNPMVGDTDGDLSPDGEEVNLGTNPNDPTSFPT
ncbi:hypothetical protein BH09CHL1_BH09CHL1_13760 [soil metagenome]